MPLTTALLVFPPLQIGDRNGELTAQVNMAQLRAALGLGPGDEDVGAAHPCSGYEAQGEFLGFWGHWEVPGITRCGEGEAFASGQEIQMPEQDEAVKCLRHKGGWDVFALCFPSAAKAGKDPQKRAQNELMELICFGNKIPRAVQQTGFCIF